MRRDLVSALFWLAVAIFAAAQGLALKLGSLKQPGSGFFPFWGGVVLGLLSLVLVARSLGRQSAAGPLVPARVVAAPRRGGRDSRLRPVAGARRIRSRHVRVPPAPAPARAPRLGLQRRDGRRGCGRVVGALPALAEAAAPPRPARVLSVEIVQGVLYGFQVALQPINLLYCFVGVLIGTLVGVLPGLGPAAAIALLLPSTFSASPVSAVIMLAGIYYGAMYGGSTTSILVNIPGEAASVVTCLDGHAMARQGRAGAALGISAFGSVIAGTLSVIVLTFMAPSLAKVALSFGPPEYFSLMVLGLTILTYFARESMVKALMMAAVGLLCGSVGVDSISGRYRFTFGIQILMDGLGLVPVIMGLFGISEVLLNLERGPEKQEIFATPAKGLLPSREDWRLSTMPILRGSMLEIG